MNNNNPQLGYQAAGLPNSYNAPNQFKRSQHTQVLGNSRNNPVNNPVQSNFYNHSGMQMENLQFNRLHQHNVHYHTDKLYDPLRNTVFHPENVKYYQKQVPKATRHSYLTRDYKILTPQEAENIKRNTFIPHNVDLAQTDHFYKVKDKQFVAVNTETRVIGKSISPLQLQRIKQQGVKKSMVVYDLKQKIQQVDPVTTYVPPPIQQYKQKQYKYNLFSIIDEPMNWVRQVGCKGAKWCVPNQVIASKNQPQSMRWLK